MKKKKSKPSGNTFYAKRKIHTIQIRVTDDVFKQIEVRAGDMWRVNQEAVQLIKIGLDATKESL